MMTSIGGGGGTIGRGITSSAPGCQGNGGVGGGGGGGGAAGGPQDAVDAIRSRQQR